MSPDAYLMRKRRTLRNLDASLFFDPDEMRGACPLTKKKMPATPPTLHEVVRRIAQVGGFLVARATENREPKCSGVEFICQDPLGHIPVSRIIRAFPRAIS